jgi:hypothetical protein
LYLTSEILLKAGADPGFQVRGAHLKKLRRAEGGAKIVGVFRVKNYDFTPKNHIFSNFRGGAGCPPPLDPPLESGVKHHNPNLPLDLTGHWAYKYLIYTFLNIL